LLDDVNRTIEALLKAELSGDVAGQVTISFVTPDDSFPPSWLSLPAVNFFLFEVQENLALRELEPAFDRAADGSVMRVPPPVRVDCHYLVSAVAAASQQAGGPEEDEAHLLGAVLKVLLRHRELPATALRGSLKGLTPPIRAAAARPGAHPTGIDLWQALKGKPRATLHYTLTVAVDISVPETIAGPVGSLSVGGA
jgi:hypothetical protein